MPSFSEEAITTYFNIPVLTQPAQTGLELPTRRQELYHWATANSDTYHQRMISPPWHLIIASILSAVFVALRVVWDYDYIWYIINFANWYFKLKNSDQFYTYEYIETNGEVNIMWILLLNIINRNLNLRIGKNGPLSKPEV
jgi:hypothetical protein